MRKGGAKMLKKIKRWLYRIKLTWKLRRCTKPVRDFGINIGLTHYDNYQEIKKLKPVQGKDKAGKRGRGK